MSQLFISPMGVSLFERKEALRLGGAPAQNKLFFSFLICENLAPQAPSTHLYPCSFLVERNTSLSPWFTTLPETQNHRCSLFHYIHVTGPLGDPDSHLDYDINLSFGWKSPQGFFDRQSVIESTALNLLSVVWASVIWEFVSNIESQTSSENCESDSMF